MPRSIRYPFAALLTTPGVLFAHPGHAPGEPEHWVVAVLFAAVSLTALSLWQRRQATARARRRGERK